MATKVGGRAASSRPSGLTDSSSKLDFRMATPAGLGALAMMVRPPPVTAPPSLYQDTSTGFVCHPDAPRGSGGFGFFRQPGFLDSSMCGTDRGLPHPRSPAAKRLVAEQVTATKAATGFPVVDIPAIMRARGWSNGAALLESWFSRPASTAPAYDVPDASTIKMSWVLKFGRAKKVYDKLIRERTWLIALSAASVSA